MVIARSTGGIIFGVADNGTSHICKLYPNLVMASGVQNDFQPGVVISVVFGTMNGTGMDGVHMILKLRGCQAVVKTGRFCARSILAADAGSVGAAILYHIILESAFRCGRLSVYQGKIVLAKAFLLKLMVQRSGSGRCPGKNKDPGYRLIQPVDDSQIWRLISERSFAFGTGFVFGTGLFGQMTEQYMLQVRRAGTTALGGQSVGLLTHNYFFVFI